MGGVGLAPQIDERPGIGAGQSLDQAPPAREIERVARPGPVRRDQAPARDSEETAKIARCVRIAYPPNSSATLRNQATIAPGR